MTLFRRQGFAGWCKTLAVMRQEAVPPLIADAETVDLPLPEDSHASLVAVLSQLVLARYREVVS